jgi:putative ABC transport system permease protein
MWRRYRRLLRPDIAADVDEELQFHLEMRSREYEERGLSSEAARQAARERFGDVDRVASWLRRHDHRRTRARGARETMSTIAQDLRVGMRALLKQPTFTVSTVLTLALGIGATTAMFSVVYGVLLEPLPFGDPDRLVRVWTAYKPHMGRGAVSAANGRDWRAENRVFEDLALVHTSRQFNFTAGDEPERLRGARVSANLFRILEVTPLIGRTFTDEENEMGRDNVVVLGHALWVREFGASSSVVGRTIRLNGAQTTVVGVMRPDFHFPSRDFELWVPLAVPADEYLQRNAGSYSAIARLKPGVTLEQARADLRAVSASLARRFNENANVEAALAPLHDDMVGSVQRPLYVLLGAVGAMLLIGCANLANLLLTRGVARRRELSVRTALGASRRRLVAQMIVELVPLLALGGVIGIVLAMWSVRALVPLLPPDLPRTEGIGINGPVLGFTAMVVVLIALLVGVWPALDAARRSVSATVAELSRGSTSAPSRTRMRDLLVVGQIAMTLLLLVGATVLMRSLFAVRQVSPGFNPERVLSAHVAIPRARYPLDRDVTALYTRVLDRAQALPSVEAVGAVNRLPLGGGNQTGGVVIEGGESDVTSVNVQTRTVTPDYFRALEIPIREGRSFTSADVAEASMVAIVDEKLARAAWPGRSAIGRRIREGDGAPWSTIVGVVGHIRHTRLDDESEPQVYWNYPQRSQDRMALVVKTRGDPAALTRALAAAVRQIDSEQPIYDARPLDDVVDRSLGQRQFQTTLLCAFAATALMLATVGVYGVIAYSVSQRRREFGVRIALGARRHDVAAMVLRHGGALFVVGAAAGLAVATVGARVLSTLVYDVAPRDPVSFVGATLVLLVVSGVACYVPARRAARVEPSIALRDD